MMLFFVRHGDPIYETNSLTERGFKQADALTERLSAAGIDKIYVSSSRRAQLTAAPTAKALGIEPEILDWTNEDYTWMQLSIVRDDGFRNWIFYEPDIIRRFNSPQIRDLGREWYTAPDLQRFEYGITRVQRETDTFLASLGYVHDLENSCYVAEKPDDRRIALFAHQGFGLAFLSCLLDIPYPQFSTHFDIGHTGVSVIDFGTKEGVAFPRMLQHSNDSHIYAAGLPTEYNNVIRF